MQIRRFLSGQKKTSDTGNQKKLTKILAAKDFLSRKKSNRKIFYASIWVFWDKKRRKWFWGWRKICLTKIWSDSFLPDKISWISDFTGPEITVENWFNFFITISLQKLASHYILKREKYFPDWASKYPSKQEMELFRSKKENMNNLWHVMALRESQLSILRAPLFSFLFFFFTNLPTWLNAYLS